METITDSQSARMLTLAAYLLGVKLMCKHLRSELRGREYFHFFTSTHCGFLFFNTSCHTVKVSCGGSTRNCFWTVAFLKKGPVRKPRVQTQRTCQISLKLPQVSVKVIELDLRCQEDVLRFGKREHALVRAGVLLEHRQHKHTSTIKLATHTFMVAESTARDLLNHG